MVVGKIAAKTNVRTIAQKAHDVWVKHYNSVLKSGRLYQDVYEPAEACVSKLVVPPAIPEIPENIAKSMMNSAIRYMELGKRKKAANIIMELYDKGCEHIIKSAYAALKK